MNNKEKKLLADKEGEWLKESNEKAIETLWDQPLVPSDKESSQQEVYSSFSRNIAQIKRLSEEEEKALGQKIKATNDAKARKTLVLHNMRLALKMAHQYRRLWTNFMDLVQEASMGLAIAAQKWDPDVGVRFGTYAAYWIKAQLAKFLMTNSRLIHTANTRAGRKVYFGLPQVRRKLLLEGKNPTPEAIAKEMGEDVKEVSLILARLEAKEASLSTPIDQEGGVTLEDTIAKDDNNPEKESAENETQKLLADIISGFEKTLKEKRDLDIWKKHLIANDPISLVDIGKKYGVSKQRIGQIAVRIKRAFRRYIIERLGPDTQLSWLFRED